MVSNYSDPAEADYGNPEINMLAAQIRAIMPELTEIKHLVSQHNPNVHLLMVSTQRGLPYRHKVGDVGNPNIYGVHAGVSGNPIATAGHPTATGISIRIDMKEKRVYFDELNSRISGAGVRMVESVLQSLPDHKYSVGAGSWSHTNDSSGPPFWERVRKKHAEKFS